MSDDPSAPSPGRPSEAGRDRHARRAPRAQAARRRRSSCPSLTVVLAFLMGGARRRSRRGHNPLIAYQRHLQRRRASTGSSTRRRRHRVEHRRRTTSRRRCCRRRRSSSPASPSPSRSAAGCSTSAARASTSSASIVANWVGVAFAGMNTLPHILLAIVAATLAGAVWAGIAGVLKATVGAHEVISTIMLNWIAFWIGVLALRRRRAAAELDASRRVPISSEVVDRARSCPTSGASRASRALHIGFFIALARARRLLGRSSTGRRSATRCARWASTPMRPRTAAST